MKVVRKRYTNITAHIIYMTQTLILCM